MLSSAHALWLSLSLHREEFRGPVSIVHSRPQGFTQTHTQTHTRKLTHGHFFKCTHKAYKHIRTCSEALINSCRSSSCAYVHTHTRAHTHSWPVATVFKQAWYWNPAVGRTVGFAEVHSMLLIKVSLLWKLCLWLRAIHTRGVLVSFTS